MTNAPIKMETAFPLCTVKVFRESENESDLFCVTRAEENTVCLETTLDSLQYTPPQIDERLCMQSATADAAYRLTIRVAEVAINNWITLVGEREGEIQHIQRRAKHRLLANVPIRITREHFPAREPLSLITEDINSIGMRILTRMKMPVADPLRITINLGDGLPAIVCGGNVVRCHRLNKDLFEIGVRFNGLDKANENRLIQALLQQLFQM